MRFTLPKPLVILTLLLFIAFACQDEPMEDPVPEFDQDMAAAVLLVDDYLNSYGGRTASNTEVSITVFKYVEGKLLYRTYLDGTEVYEEVTEETVTATAEPGELLFWCSGKGVTDLDGIDFDPQSEAYLQDNPDEIFYNKLWVVQVPEDIDPNAEYLKYDIVYDYEGNPGPIIRLDPKIKLGGNNEAEDEGDSNSDSGQN